MRAQRPLRRIEQLIPVFLRRRILERTRHKFVPRIQIVSARSSHRTGQHMKQHQGAGWLPSAQIAGRAAPPKMRCEAASGSRDLARRLDDDVRFHSAFFFRKLRREFRVVPLQRLDQSFETLAFRPKSVDFKFFPVGPALHKLGVEAIFPKDNHRHCQQHRCFGPGIARHPVVRHARRIRKARIHDGKFRSRHFSFNNALGVRIEIMARLKMGGEQKNKARVSVVRRRPVGIVPEQITKPRRRRAHIRVRVVAVDAPRLQGAFHREVVSRPAHVIHDFFAAIFLERFADARAESFEHLVPRSSRPLPTAARPGPLHRIKDAIGIVNLIDRRRAFRAEPPAAGWMFRVSFKLGDLSGRLIDIGEKSARRLAVEADGGDDLVMLFDAARPGCGIVLDPVVPLLDRRTIRKMAAVALEFGHRCISIFQPCRWSAGRPRPAGRPRRSTE